MLPNVLRVHHALSTSFLWPAIASREGGLQNVLPDCASQSAPHFTWGVSEFVAFHQLADSPYLAALPLNKSRADRPKTGPEALLPCLRQAGRCIWKQGFLFSDGLPETSAGDECLELDCLLCAFLHIPHNHLTPRPLFGHDKDSLRHTFLSGPF